MTEWHARAPVRFCDLGGWTDTRMVPRGAILNIATTLYTYVTLRVEEGASGIKLENLDADEQCSYDDIRQMEFNGVLDLLKAALSRILPHRPDTFLHVPPRKPLLSNGKQARLDEDHL